MREQSKTLAHLQQQLKDFGEAYKLIKTERNHTHAQINKLQQVYTIYTCTRTYVFMYSNAKMLFVCTCVCVCVRACVRACVHACVCVCVCSSPVK